MPVARPRVMTAPPTDPAGHAVVVEWNGDGDFLAGRYSRAHLIRFDGGAVIAASASPSVVPSPYSVAEAIDPEEMLLAAISSCHMLWFLDFARRDGLDVERYHDAATGRMGANADGRSALIEAVLRPRIVPAFGFDADPARLTTLHAQAHQACFIANSVKTAIRIEPVALPPGEFRHG